MNKAEYKIGKFHFVPERKLLICTDSNVEQELDKKQTEILYYFVTNPKTLITRESLVAEVWKRNFVADHTINTKISELRKLLKDDYKNPYYLKTHHQRGYELVAECEIIHPMRVSKRLISKALVSTFSIAIFIALAIFITAAPSKKSINKFQLKPITTERGQEWAPVVSNNNKLLAYSHRTDEFSNWQIRVKDLTSHKVTLVTQGLFNSTYPIWNNDSSGLYFIKSIQGKCEIWRSTRSVKNTYSNHFFTSCGSQKTGSGLAITENEQWLYYVHSTNNKSTVNRIDLKTETVEVLLKGLDNEGVKSLSLSPDETKLALLITNLTTKANIVSLDINNAEKTILNEIDNSSHYVEWSQDSQSINYINIENELKSINIDSKNISTIANFQHKTLYPYLSHKDQWYVIDGSFYSSEIISFKFDNEWVLTDEKHEVYSSYSDSAPTFHPTDDKLSFTSNRGNIEQIWLKEKEHQFGLTEFKHHGYITNKSFSPNGKYILFLKDGQPYLFDILKHQQIELASEFKLSRSPIWSCDGRKIYLVSKTNSEWSLFSIDVANFDSKKLLNGVIDIKSDCHVNQYISQQLEGQKLVIHSPNFDDSNSIDIRIKNNISDWSIVNNTLFQLSNDKLYKTSLENGNEVAINLPNGIYSDFLIRNNRIYLSRRILQETKIKQLVTY